MLSIPYGKHCRHKSLYWCPECVEQLYKDHDAYVQQMNRYDVELGEAARLLQSVLPIGQIKAIGYLEVSAGIELLIAENEQLHRRLARAMGQK